MKHTLLLQALHKIEKSFLEKIFTESEFIDPIDEILKRLDIRASCNISKPFVVTDQNEVVAFFTIESSNMAVTGEKSEKGIYWLESFFITKSFIGKGYAKLVVLKLLEELPAHLTDIEHLNLTVNLRNRIAQNVYKKCGFIDTEETYLDGPAGPQAIYNFPMTS